MSYSQPKTTSELRQRVLTFIDKLSDRATFSAASSELNSLATTLSSSSLPTFLTCILSVDSSSKPPARAHCLHLLTLLAQNHIHDPSLLSPHVHRSILPFLLRRLRDPDSSVRHACSAAVAALSPLGVSLLSPLLGALFAEQDPHAQMGACVCLKAAVDAGEGVDKGEEGELRRGLARMVKMVKVEGFKPKAAVMAVVASVVLVNDGAVVNAGKDGGMVGSVVGCAVEMLSCDDWAARKAAAEVLLAVAHVAEEEAVMELKEFVVNALDSRKFDKVKATRGIMNGALQAWKKLPGGPLQEDLPLSVSNSSFSKDNVGASPSVLRRSSFAGIEAPKPKKTINKTRSQLCESSPVTSIASSTSTSTINFGSETPPQRWKNKKTMSKSKSCLSDDSSTATDSCSSVSKSSYHVSLQTSQTQWKKQSPSEKVVLEDEATQSQSETVQVNSIKRISGGKAAQKAMGRRSGSSVVPFIEEECRVEDEGDVHGQTGENNVDILDVAVIRNHLLQIERQQSYLLDLLQKYMGKSQSGIESLEMRVSGLENALDKISSDLAVQSGRIQGNGPVGTTCCPSTDFLSPKFWRKVEGRPSSTSKSFNSRSMPNKDGNTEVMQMDEDRFHEQNRDNGNKYVKGIGQIAQRGTTYSSPRSFDTPSNTP